MRRFSRRMLGALAIGLGLAVQPLLGAKALAQQPKPNILFILADNTGYGDLGVYGGGELRGAPTPRIDRLAAEGLRLTQFLVEPACTPSRAALMTGRYSIRSGLSLVAVEGTAISLPATDTYRTATARTRCCPSISPPCSASSVRAISRRGSARPSWGRSPAC